MPTPWIPRLCPHGRDCRTRFNGGVRYESYPQRAVHRSRKCRLARHRTGADEFTRLSGARRHRLWFAGSTGFHQSLFLYHHRHALRTSMLLARERGETFAGFKQSRYASGEYFSQYLQGNWQPKTAKVGELFARSGITLPTREMWAQLRDDVMRYGIYTTRIFRRCRQPVLSLISTMLRRVFIRLWRK